MAGCPGRPRYFQLYFAIAAERVTAMFTKKIIGVVALCLLLGAASVASAALVTPHTKLLYNGTITGSAGNWTYNAGAGEVIPDGFTVHQNDLGQTVAVSGGIATFTSGSTTNDASFLTPCPTGTLMTTSYVVEAMVKPTLYAVPDNIWGRSYLVESCGLEVYFNGSDDTSAEVYASGLDATKQYKSTSFGSWTASTTVPKDAWTHVAIVQTSGGTSALYVNGTLMNEFAAGTFPGDAPQRSLLTWNDVYAPGNPIGIGNFSGDGGFTSLAGGGNGGFNGEMDGWALSSFTGTFNPATDFVLSAPIPEPSTLVLLGCGLLGLLAYAWRKRK